MKHRPTPKQRECYFPSTVDGYLVAPLAIFRPWITPIITPAPNVVSFRLPHPNPMFPLGPASSSTSRRRIVAGVCGTGVRFCHFIARAQTLVGALIYL